MIACGKILPLNIPYCCNDSIQHCIFRDTNFPYMRFSIKSRIALDAAMAIALIIALAFRITGDFFHEWIGLAACAMLAWHNLLNARWYLGFFKGKYGAARLLNAAVNALLSAFTKS